MTHLKALDGIRGIAIAMVLLVQGGVWFMGGGFYGVDVFFVLSGFLITYLLLGEFRATGSIDLPAFWARRALRLLPAMAVVVAFVLLLVHLRFRDRFDATVSDAIDTISYRINWQSALADQPPQLGMLSHAWSLAIEMQFYVIWPPVLFVLLIVGRRWGRAGARSAVVLVTVAALALSLGGMILRAAEIALGFPWWRTYFGTDARIDALLMGCAVAGLYRLHRLDRWPRWAGSAGAALILLMGVWGSLDGLWDRYWGTSLVTVAAAFLVIDALRGGPTVAPLSLAPVVFLGRISYGMYLWHWPVFAAINESWVSAPEYLLLAGRIAVTLAMATLSYYVVELPALRLKRRFTRSGSRVADGQGSDAAETGDARGSAFDPSRDSSRDAEVA